LIKQPIGRRDFLKNLFQNTYTNADDIINMQDALKAIYLQNLKVYSSISKELMDSIEVYYFSKVRYN
jgi:hypothetical protein